MFTHFVDSAAADRSSLESKFPATAPTGEKIIYGDTDIIVFGRNSVNGGNKSGFYRIDYMIQNSLGETPVPARTAFVMGGEMDPSSSLLHTTYLAPPTSDPEDGLVDWDNYYNITNSGPALENVQLYSNTQTHAWQTKVLYGVVDDVAMSTSAPTGAGGLPAALLNHNPDGSTTYTPKYPDGKYKVLVKAYSYPLVNVPSVSTSWVWRDVIVDNARPYLERLEVIGPDDEPKYVHQWGFDGATLTRSAPTTYELIGAGDNTINLHFSEPVTGVTLAIDSFSDFSGFQSSEPAGAQQNFTGTFEVARSTAHDGLRRAAVTAKDLAGNELLALTTSQLTIAPSLQLTRNEAGALGGTGGADVSLFMIDTSTEPPAVVVFRPITITTYTEVLGECRGACYSVNVDGSTEPYVYLNRNTVQFMYADASGLGKLDVRRLSGEEAYANSFSTGMYVTTMTITLTDGIYRQTIADRLGNATTMYFYVDPAAPELTLAAINVDSLLQVEGITGTARDTASGLAYVVANPPMPGPLGHVYPGEPLGEVLRYDGTTAAVNWAFGGFPYAVGAAAEHYYYAEDRAGSMSWWPIGINSGKGNGISPSVLTTPANISSRLTEIDIDGSSDTGHACSVALTGTGLASPLIKGAPANTAHTFTLPAGESSAHYSTNFYLTGNINVTNGSGCQLQGIGGESGLLWFSDSAAGRMEEAPVGLSATLMTDHWSVKLASITQPGTFGALELPYVPPSGYFTYPPGDNQSLYVVVNGVAYQKAVISVPGVEGGQIAYDGVLMATSYDAASGKNFIELPHISSLFALLVPAGMYDNLAPVTKIARSYESGGLLYAGPRVRLRATDYGPSSATIAGVATSYYVLDGGLGACGLSPDPAACDGINTATGAFTVAEGAHLLSYASVDYAGNFELAVSSTIYVDATAPLTEVSAAGRVLSPESTENITETDEISLAAADPVSNGLASNVKGTRYYIDVATSSCTGYPSYTGPAGTCENPKYYGPFTLSAGTHTVYYASMDNVWNREEIKTVNFIVGGVDPGLDTVPPVVSAWANGQEIPDGGAVSVSTFAPITLTAVDDGSGVAYVFYSLDVQLSSQTAVVYSNPFVLGVGTHLLYYTARDNAGIVANIRTATITVIQSNQTTDTTPPVVVLSANGQAVPNGGGITITTFTAITLNATDDNSGVDGIFYSVDIMLSSQSVTVYTEPFMLPAGMHMVYYTATDKSGNMAGIQAATITVIQSGPPADTTPPVVSAWADGLEIPAGGTAEITSTMTVVLTATDDNTGADGIFYSVDIMLTQQTVQVYSAPFALAVGTHTLYYTAKDKAGNIAAIKNAAIAVTQAVQPSDTIPPVVSAWAAGLEIADGGAVAIEVLTPVTLTASDDNSGVAGVYYSVDAPLTQQTGLGYSAPLLLAAGTHVVYYVAKDNAGNVSAIRTANITVNPQPAAGGTYYVDGLAGNDNNAGDSSASAFRSLNRALSSAQAGSVIIISSGVYHESVFINVENITLLGQYGAVLDGDMNGDGAPDMQAGIMLNNTSGARIEGLAFHNYQTGLIAGSAAGLSVSSCVFTANSMAAIQVNGSQSVTIAWNTMGGSQQGIWADGDNISIRNNTVYANTGAGIYVSAQNAYELKNNIVTGSQWGILVNKASTIDYNDVWGNTDNNYGMSVASSIIPSSGLKGAHDISVDPDFVNVAGNDVRLYEGSLCLASGENGLNMGAYAGTGVAYVPAPLNVQHLRNIGGWGTEAGRFSAPTDVSVARWGSAIYVTDSLNFRVQKLTVDGRPLGTFGSFGSGPGQFGGPIQTAVGVATGPVSGEVTQNDLLYVADPGNFRVQLFMAGKYVTSFGNRGNGPGQFEAVSWVAAAPRTNTVYVSDEVLNRVQVFSALGVYQRTIGAGVLSGPRALAVRNLGTDDSAAALYVLDGGNNRIAVFTGTELTASWSGDFAGAASLHVADNSRVYVSDARGWVTMYSGAGRYLGKFGASGVDALQFQQPKGLATDPAGYLYIADSLNDRVQKVWIAGDDVTAPGPVTPSAAYVSPWYTLLSFNAAGDDGVAGTAAWYDVRYSSTSALTTPEAFEAAMPSYIPYQPKSAGADEMITASGLEPGHTYSMALRVYDESGNYVQSAPVAFTTSVKVPTGHLLPYAGFDDMYVSRNDGYPAVIAWLGAPAGLAVDQSGSGLLYAASVAGEENSSLIRAIAPGTNIIATAAGLIGSGYAGDGGDAWRATLNNPRGVAVDPAGNLLIADTGNNRIRRVDKQTNEITTIAGTGAAGYSGDGGQALSAAINAPGGIAVDGAGNIYFADSGNNVIRKISASGVITTLAGNGTTGYNGENIAATAAMLSDPRDVKLDTAGNLYITEAAGHRIRRISAQSGVITTLAGTGVAGSSAENVPAQGAQVNSPSGLAIDPNGVVYFAEAGGHRVRKIGLDGIVRTVAGTGVDGTAQEGPSALASQLSSPKGIAGDWSRGLLYIADAERITALGVTVAPVTAGSIEGPQFKAFGLTVISTYTPVSLNVPAGSGVQGTYYQLTDLKTSEAGAVTVYSSSFTLAQGTWLIRYWSVDADGNAEATKELRVAVTPWLDTALLAAGTITAAGNAAVTGPAITNSLATLSGNTVINGPLTALRVTISGNASVSGQLSTGTATADAAPLYLPNLLADSAGANNNAAINSHLSDGALTLAGSNSLVLSTGVYYLKGLILSGSSKITLTGPVELIVDGDIKLSGSAAINKDGAASNLLVFVSTNGKVELGGSAVLSAYVYAPQAALSLGGNTALTGHYFAGSAALAGSAVLAVAAPPGRSRTMAAAGVSGYATVQAIATFQPGEWYAFPNPSKTGAVTFHFECGVADQAGVVVSDISGHKVHEANMGAASIINGKYAYRHIWNVNNTASGVYIYILRAKKAGEGTIVKKGKVAVIR